MRWILLFLSVQCFASNQFVTERNVFSGEVASNLTDGAPLSVSSTGKLISGIPNSSAYNDANFTCTTTDQVVTGVTLSAPPAGTYEVTMAGDISSPTSGVVVTMHFQSNGATTTHGSIKTMPFAGGTLTSGSQRIPFAKTVITTLNGTNALEVWCSTSSNTVTVANTSLTYVRLL